MTEIIFFIIILLKFCVMAVRTGLQENYYTKMILDISLGIRQFQYSKDFKHWDFDSIKHM